jgi:hypothetical protein
MCRDRRVKARYRSPTEGQDVFAPLMVMAAPAIRAKPLRAGSARSTVIVNLGAPPLR